MIGGGSTAQLTARGQSGELAEAQGGLAAEGRLWGIRVLILASALGLWELASGRLIETFWVSKPSLILGRLTRWIGNGSLFFHAQITLQEAIAGFFIGAGSGMVLGFVLGNLVALARVIDPYIMAIYALPKLALAPLLILWFGIGIKTKIVLAAVIVFFYVFYNTYAGVREVDKELLDVIKVMGGNQWDLMRIVTIPSALIWVFAGLKISIPHAITGAVIGEIIASNRGLGFMLMSSSGQFDTAGVFAVLTVLFFIGVFFNEILTRSEAFFLRWKVAGH